MGPRDIRRHRDVPAGRENQDPYSIARDLLDEHLNQLAGSWLPPFCASDFERIARDYIPRLALLRLRVLISESLTEASEGDIEVIDTRFRAACELHLRNRASGA